jgi:hypothetical protein
MQANLPNGSNQGVCLSALDKRGSGGGPIRPCCLSSNSKPLEIDAVWDFWRTFLRVLLVHQWMVCHWVRRLPRLPNRPDRPRLGAGIGVGTIFVVADAEAVLAWFGPTQRREGATAPSAIATAGVVDV